MRHVVDFAKNEGYDTVWLGVYELNYPALAFYHRMGFSAFAIGEFILGNTREVDLLLKRTL
jgi:ribosomal protein S18 acetylase RimI-like enzyme